MVSVTDAQIEALSRYPTAIVTDGLKRLGLRDAWARGIHPVSKTGRSFAGRAVVLTYDTVSDTPAPALPGQFALINACAPGDVLVYAARGVDAWLIGDNVVTLCKHRKLAGVVVDGAARDIDALAELDFATFVRGASASPYSHEIRLTSIDTPATVAGATVSPGDIVTGDSDGVVVVPAAAVEELLFQLEHLLDADTRLGEAVEADAPLEELDRLTALKGQLRKKDIPA